MERRQFLQYAGSSVAAIALAQCTRSSNHQRPNLPLVSRDGGLTVDLTATEQRVTLAGQSAQLLTYNGQVPGPLWEVRAGDTVVVNFTNGLAQPTNLHFHGLHIPPTGNADNVFVSVPSGEQFRYEFAIAPTHPGGLFWYHPHHHGLVAAQLAGGLAGPLIVRGAVDEIPEIQAASEAILVLQDFDLTRWGSATRTDADFSSLGAARRPDYGEWRSRSGGHDSSTGIAATATAECVGLSHLSTATRKSSVAFDRHGWQYPGGTAGVRRSHPGSGQSSGCAGGGRSRPRCLHPHEPALRSRH
jgi:FtsP/CotA-like multicopper oxidase with cupredoxin domain